MKAQASLEQLVLVGIALMVLVGAFVITSNYLSDSAKISQAQDAVQRLAAAADYVSALGADSKETVSVYLPAGVISSNVTGNSIILTVATSSGRTDVFATTKAPLAGALPSGQAGQLILVQSLSSGKVLIGQAGLACNPALLTKILGPGNSSSDVITVSNVADYNVTGISAALTGGSGLASIGSVSSSALQPGQNATLTVSYSVPGSQAPGTYGATVVFNSDRGDTCTSQITISVTGTQSCPAGCQNENYMNGTCRSNATTCWLNGEDYHSENDAGCAATPDTPSCCCFPTIYQNNTNGTGNGSINDTFGPIVTNMSHTNTTNVFSTFINETATATDAYTGNNNISACLVRVDGGAWAALPASDGAYDSPTEAVNLSLGTLSVGPHTVAMYCNDSRGNVGNVFNDTFYVTSGDIMIIIDRSGSMADPITNAINDTTVSTTSTSFVKLKSVTATYQNGQLANLTVSIKSSKSTCQAFFEARNGTTVIASGNTTSTGYATFTTTNFNVSSYAFPMTLDLYLRISSGGCTATNQKFDFTQLPTKMQSAAAAANSFVDIMANASAYAGLVSFS
ncbi:MAG: hypothetical protein KGH63_02050, partial [Candidatus Micrarchaeota archaeon]|nr:hypothetical protein [Candidatus Micrarchaeota archaeon]